MIQLAVLREFIMFLVLLVLLAYGIFGTYNEYRRKKNMEKVKEKTDRMLSDVPQRVADELLKKADDERPIMLMVNPDKVARIVTEKILKTERRSQNEK